MANQEASTQSGVVTSTEYALTGAREFSVATRQFAELANDNVRIRFLACALCGSDLTKYEDTRELAYPISMGHEFIAEIVGVGMDVSGFEIGDVVTSDLNYRCGECDHCRGGRSHLCRSGQIGDFSNRAFADFADIKSEYLARINGSALPHLALAEPLSCILHAKDWAAVGPNDRVLVLGAGGLGLCMAFAFWAETEQKIFSIDDLNCNRLDAVTTAASPLAHAGCATEIEYDVVFDLTGTESGIQKALSMVRSGGRLCSMSHISGTNPAPFFLNDLMRRDITFKMIYLNGEPDNLKMAIRLLQLHWTTQWDECIETYPLAELSSAFANRRSSNKPLTMIEVNKI